MALKKLKETEEHLSVVQKRVMVLRAKEEGNRKKEIQQQNKSNYLSYVKMKINEDK